MSHLTLHTISQGLTSQPCYCPIMSPTRACVCALVVPAYCPPTMSAAVVSAGAEARESSRCPTPPRASGWPHLGSRSMLDVSGAPPRASWPVDPRVGSQPRSECSCGGRSGLTAVLKPRGLRSEVRFLQWCDFVVTFEVSQPVCVILCNYERPGGVE